MEQPATGEVISDSAEVGDLKSCQICGRTFNPKSLERHEKICEKTKTKRRNVFNSFLQRAKETGAVPTTVTEKQNPKSKKIKWKEDHENFVNIVKSNNRISQSESQYNRSSSQKSFPSAGYIQCSTCSRYFSQKAADRHISWCQEQQTRMPKTPSNSEALERLKARVKYRAPLPGKKKYKDSERLTKSAGLFRGPSILRTHSSPSLPGRSSMRSKGNSSANEPALLHRRTSLEKNCINVDNNNCTSELNRNKKVVKFKDKFPDYENKRETSDMLTALRLQLSRLDASDNYFRETCNRPSTNGHYEKNNLYTLDKPIEVQYPWTSAEDVRCSTSSSSDGSLPSLSRIGSSERCMPRFCYNCGTKYPIVSAKYCCECGARRLIIESNNNYFHT